MFKTIAVTKVKAMFSELLDRVSKGEEFLITRRGKVVARLVPAHGRSREQIERAVDELKALRRSTKVSLEEIIAWKNQGRP